MGANKLALSPQSQEILHRRVARSEDLDEASLASRDWEQSPMYLPPVKEPLGWVSSTGACDPDDPRIFHMYWNGNFTDKPYLSILSFLYTQNLSLHALTDESHSCPPQLWMWINPDTTALVPGSSLQRELFLQLRANQWASPFLHPRFKDIVHFKLWSTPEQMDSVPELRDEWRKKRTIRSGGHIVVFPSPGNSKASSMSGTAAVDPQSADSYDRLSVILSDTARFILCHRFG